jgi:hypothetical protein
MAFSFGRSNLQNLARMPVAGAVFLVSMITPRRANLWVFGRKGMFGGNSRYLMEYVRERRPDIDCVWLAHSDKELEEARAAGVRAERASSWRGWALSLRAKVGVVSLGFGDVEISNSYRTPSPNGAIPAVERYFTLGSSFIR